MPKLSCDFRLLLIPVALLFIYIQISEHNCTSEMRVLTDIISMLQEQIVALQEGKRRKEQESAQLKGLFKISKRMALKD